MTYTPQPGTVAARVVAWLQARPSGEYNASQIAEALKVDPKIIASSLEVALREKLVFHRQRDRTSPRAPWWYSARDREEHARRNGFAAAATWMPAQKINRKDAEESGSSPGTPGASGTPEVSSASSAEAAAADAPSGDEGAAADADRAAAPAPDTSAPGSQQVLKAEAARPDATDRETPDTASPAFVPCQDKPGMLVLFSVGAMHRRVGLATRLALTPVDLGPPRLRAPPLVGALGHHLPDFVRCGIDQAGNG